MKKVKKLAQDVRGEMVEKVEVMWDAVKHDIEFYMRELEEAFDFLIREVDLLDDEIAPEVSWVLDREVEKLEDKLGDVGEELDSLVRNVENSRANIEQEAGERIRD
jgi:predicted  nucleic acid-binding Zn-ribbon protein